MKTKKNKKKTPPNLRSRLNRRREVVTAAQNKANKEIIPIDCFQLSYFCFAAKKGEANEGGALSAVFAMKVGSVLS